MNMSGAMNMMKRLKQLAVVITLLSGAVLVQAEEADVCAPFMKGKVDASLLATMLSAAGRDITGIRKKIRRPDNGSDQD